MGRRRPSSFETAKRTVAGKQMFGDWRVTGVGDEAEEEEEGWGMSGQRQAVKKWARPSRQRNSASSTINHRGSLIFEGGLPVQLGCQPNIPPAMPVWLG